MGFVVQPSDAKATYETAKQVIEKEWPEEIAKKFQTEQFPFILIINEDFRNFDPRQHPWTIFWGSNEITDLEQVYKLFSKILQLIKAGDNLFDYFKEHQKETWYKKLFKHIEIKPKIFGVTVDAKAIIGESFS